MKLAYIGLGTMGAPMAANLLKAGYNLTVYNRTRNKEISLVNKGAKRANSPKEAAIAADVVFTNLSDSADVAEVVLGNTGVIYGMKAGSILIDLSTISPKTTKHIAQELAKKDIEMLDAPVSGGSEGAINATLSIMVGGKADILEKVMPLLETMGKSITLVGPIGSGQITKAINQTILAGTYNSVAEGIVLGLAAGIDIKSALNAVSGGAAASWVLDNRAENMINDNYPLGFKTSLYKKDLGIALETAKELGVAMPVAAYVEQLETSLVKRGYGDEDISNIARIVREQAGIE